ncbi:hypothetical protein EBI01_00530 [Marinomonas rhizomae]|nr:hypothetical protein EBI01_00530 [Marinomonas rhizomae]
MFDLFQTFEKKHNDRGTSTLYLITVYEMMISFVAQTRRFKMQKSKTALQRFIRTSKRKKHWPKIEYLFVSA